MSALFQYQLFDDIVRAVLVVCGLFVAVHFHFMANFITRAPWFVRFVSLPGVQFSGTGMMFCGILGDVGLGLLLSLSALSFGSTIQYAAWSAGAYVAQQFEMAARANQAGWAFVNQLRTMHEDVFGDDGRKEVETSAMGLVQRDRKK